MVEGSRADGIWDCLPGGQRAAWTPREAGGLCPACAQARSGAAKPAHHPALTGPGRGGARQRVSNRTSLYVLRERRVGFPRC